MASFEPIRIIRTLATHEVRYVLIGGVAAAAHGSPSVTQDLDICHDVQRDNLERLARALRELNARLRGVDEDVPFRLDARALAAGDRFTFTTDAGNLDCLGRPPGTHGYDDLVASAVDIDLDGFQAAVASLEDLIRMKTAAGRPRDRAELEILGALRDEIEDQT